MKRNKSKLTLLSILIILINLGCHRIAEKDDSSDFSFVFITDIHLQPEKMAPEGFAQAIDTINSLNPSFVIAGGDLIMDANNQTYSRADSLYNLYLSVSEKLEMPLYNSMGNHEVFGTNESSGVEKEHPEYGEKMYEKRLGRSYYAFEYKGWKFIILNSVEDNGNYGYMGLIDSSQMEWIKKELLITKPNTPIVVTTHIPFISTYSQVYQGSTVANSESLVVTNSKEVVALFSKHNLKLVLQGHHHLVEDIFVNEIHYITGGAIAAAWWEGPNRGFEEGFMQFVVKDDQFTWKYIDYGWDALSLYSN